MAPNLRSRLRREMLSLMILDTAEMPWSLDRYGRRTKILYRHEASNAQMVLLWTPVGSVGGVMRFHSFHEWAYRLSGDTIYREAESPEHLDVATSQYREGFFMDRPPYSIHGGDVPTQMGGVVLVMEAGDLVKETFGVDVDENQALGAGFWSKPKIIDTIGRMDWQPMVDAPGVWVKRLASEESSGFRAELLRIRPGWENDHSLVFGRRYSYNSCREFNFVIKGDLRMTDSDGSDVSVCEHSFVDRRPGTVAGLATGQVSNYGCVWLQVTYARESELCFSLLETRRVERR